MAEAPPPTGIPLPEAMSGNFQDAARWFTQLWSGNLAAAEAARPGAGVVPSMMMPTLDVKELDKRIADMRSVEHWLKLNLGMLQTTIQGLEMQRNTILAWQQFAAAPGSATPANAAGGPAPADAPAFQPAMWWNALQEQFAQMAASAAAPPQEASAPGAKPAPGKTPKASGPNKA